MTSRKTTIYSEKKPKLCVQYVEVFNFTAGCIYEYHCSLMDESYQLDNSVPSITKSQYQAGIVKCKHLWWLEWKLTWTTAL